MVFIHIDKKNCINGNCNMIQELDTILGDKNKKTFLLIFMEGCGPCNATRPEWNKIRNILENKYKYNNDLLISDIDQDCLKDIKHLPISPSGFPTMVYLNKNKNIQENYENSDIKEKNRSIDSFVEWIENKVPSSNKVGGKRKNKVTLKKRKWSIKYKKSINCKRPHGFSQRQYCKYGRKKSRNKK